ncbi:ankyrin repeat domain-containing protein [Endozoicomonas sp. SCSIO W0465]|uniref:ankyrin repeat domain-containing protein n=1 Tax=Endozoicomonas sp. SCSIO W0465 TaxID=2918516 RepID=UPI002075CC76|nr:ankyrin repeat domain-containing protein [Endozoicomonas sp. SCSIO W0465]USE34522.1 ankyrin repeat domain-containing protein [Endozoicomonas sp. SCSIO W0465]
MAYVKSNDHSYPTGWSYLHRQDSVGEADFAAPVARKRIKALSCFNRSLWSLEKTSGSLGLNNTFAEISQPVRRSVSLPDFTSCSCASIVPSGCDKKMMTGIFPLWEAKQQSWETDSNSEQSWKSDVTSEGDIVAGYLLSAIESNDVEAVQSLINEPLLDINMEITGNAFRNRYTPLMLAIENNFLELARIILTVEGVEINKVFGLNALHIAVQKGYVDAADLLLRSGANVDAPDVNGWTSLMKACKIKNEDLIRLLLGYQADVKLVNRLGLSALNILVSDEGTERPDLLALLLEHGAPVDQCDRNYWFPLIVAIKNKFSEYIRILLDEGWEKATCQNEGLVFLLAATRGNESVLRCLYDKMPKKYLSFRDINQCYVLTGVPVSQEKTVLRLLKDRFGGFLSPELSDAFFSLKSQCRRVIQQQMSDCDYNRLPLPECLKNYCARFQLPILLDNEDEFLAFNEPEYSEGLIWTSDSRSRVDSGDGFHETGWE